MGLTLLPAGAAPFLEMKFHQNSSQSLANTGTAGTTATLGAPNPTYSTNTPFGGGAFAIDIAPATGGASAVDLLTGEVLNAAKDLKSFTIMGWLNCRSSSVSPGGNRIVSWYQHLNNADGVDLAMTSSGALSLGIKSWNDWNGVASNGGKITVDPASGYNNWRFFAVTYDGTASTGHVKFYFGTSTSPAELDRTATYGRGTTGDDIAPSVTLGNHSTATRTSSNHAAFRGLMDEVRVYGSKTNADGALSLSMIQTLQGAAPLAGQPGLLYQRWNSITGTTVASLTSNSRYPNSPDQTLVRTTFEGFANSGDNYGIKMSGWIEAPETGSYVFAMTSDDAGEVKLSTDANPVNKQLILSNPTWTSIGTWAQQSPPIMLEAGKFYYVEALMKEGTGGDHLKVGWRRPSDTEIQLIVAPALFVTPPETDELYPSAYHLYEPGTGTRKATMGWQKEAGNSHFYVEAEGHRSLKVQNGSLVVPDKLVFGGKFPGEPNQNDLGFRWDRPTVGDIGMLSLETQGGRWAMQVESGSEMEPNVAFNEQFVVKGENITESGVIWEPFASLHYAEGSGFTRTRQADGTGIEETQTGIFNANTLALTSDVTIGTADNLLETRVRPGTAKFFNHNIASGEVIQTDIGMGYLSCVRMSSSNVVQNRTDITSFGMNTNDVTTTSLHATVINADTVKVDDLVVAPKWKIQVPDYVFEKGYRVKSLEEVENFVKKNKHLPGIPSAKEMEAKGMNVAEMNLRLLKSVEELTLHVIELNKELKVQRNRNDSIQAAILSHGVQSKRSMK